MTTIAVKPAAAQPMTSYKDVTRTCSLSPLHRCPTKDETYVILRGKVRVTTHRDDGSIIEDVVLCDGEGRYGMNIPKGVWHTIEAGAG